MVRIVYPNRGPKVWQGICTVIKSPDSIGWNLAGIGIADDCQILVVVTGYIYPAVFIKNVIAVVVVSQGTAPHPSVVTPAPSEVMREFMGHHTHTTE